MFQMTCIQNFHSVDTTETTLSVLSVMTDTYQAHWSEHDPEKIFIRGWEEVTPDWVELQVGAFLTCTDSGHAADPSTFRADVKYDKEKINQINHYLGDNDTANLSFSCSSYLGGTYCYTVKLAIDHVRLDVNYEFDGKMVLEKATYCALSKDCASVFDADTLFNPNPLMHGMQYSSLRAKAITGSNNERWFSPAPFCFPLKLRSGKWMSVSPAPTVDELDFTGFSSTPCYGGECAFSLDYIGLPEYKNHIRLPELVLRFNADSEFSALKQYADGLVTLKKIDPVNRVKPDWWKGVMICGWFAQNGTQNCTEELYESHIAKYAEVMVDWDILTIDDFWGKEHGIWRVDEEKWHDMKGFIARQHEKGKKVLLWVCINTTGLPDDELYIVGENKLLDPLNPKYISRVYESFGYMFGSVGDSLDADGIKLDFTGRVPAAGDAKCTKKLYGMRYLYELYKLFHDAAKQAKADCLLDYQVANPHFAAFHDMTRLNDYFLPGELALSVMGTRANIAHSVTFGAEVDTDHPGSVDYYENSYKFGNMSLYISNKKIDQNKDHMEAIRRTIRDHIKP